MLLCKSYLRLGELNLRFIISKLHAYFLLIFLNFEIIAVQIKLQISKRCNGLKCLCLE